MYHEDHQHHGNDGGHHDGEPQFGEEHHKPEEHHPGELHNGAGQEGKDFHGGSNSDCQIRILIIHVFIIHFLLYKNLQKYPTKKVNSPPWRSFITRRPPFYRFRYSDESSLS